MYKTLYYNRNIVSENIGTNKTILGKEGIVCHYCILLNENFKLQSSVHNCDNF